MDSRKSERRGGRFSPISTNRREETIMVWLQFYYIEEEFGHTAYSDWGWNKKEVYEIK